ncbi:MAG: VanZ family protein [Methylocystaceae bacterium]
MKKTKLIKILSLLALLTYLCLIIYGLADAKGLTALFGISDSTKNNLHFIEYAMLYLLVILVLSVWDHLNLNTMILTPVLCLAAAALDEYRQLFIPGRTASYFDWFKDGAGIFFSWYIVSVWYFRKHKK